MFNPHHPHNNHHHHPHDNHHHHQDNPHNNHHHHHHDNHHHRENSSFNQNHRCEEYYDTLLSMRISCCEKCPRVLKKKLHRLRGVDNVEIYLEIDVIHVSGTIEPETVFKYVCSLSKKTVKLLEKEEFHKLREKHQQHQQRERVYREKPVVEEAPHKIEAYEAVKIDDRYCRYLYCKTHPRSVRPIRGDATDEACLSGFGGVMFPLLQGGPSMGFNGYHQPHPMLPFGPPAHQHHPLMFQQSGLPYGHTAATPNS